MAEIEIARTDCETRQLRAASAKAVNAYRTTDAGHGDGSGRRQSQEAG